MLWPLRFLEDVPCALCKLTKDEAGNTTKVPLEDKCEHCYDIYSKAFGEWDWKELCEAYAEDAELQASWQQAERVDKEPQMRTWSGAAVVASSTTEVEVNKTFLALSEKELTKAIGGKLSKATLKSIPSLQLFDSQGEPEEVFLFVNPEQPHRLLSIKQRHSQSLDKQCLQPSHHLYEKQGQNTWRKTAQSEAESIGVAHALCPQVTILELPEFLEKYASQSVPEKSSPSLGAALDGENSDEEL
eukprot:6490364-Amphidinium_carterae.1